MSKPSVFLDSGAYSALSCGKPIRVEDYIEYVKEHKDCFEIYANLDDITSPEKTWENQRKMEAAGLTPLPVYHMNEPEKYLRMAMEYPYFATGGMAKSAASSLQHQLDTVFRIICPKSNDYYPTNKVHGFGTSKPSIIVSYPFYSVDSSSWVKYGLYGMVLIPKIFKGKFIYNKPPMVITVSNRSKATGDSQHFNNLPQLEKETISKYFHDKDLPIGVSEIKDVSTGYTLADDEVWIDKAKTKVEKIIEVGLSNNHEIRDQANLLYYLDLEENQPAWPWQWKKKGGLYLW